MPKGKDQLFADFGHLVVTQGYGEVYQRDPRQSVPPDCGFIRFRYPGSGLYTAAGLIKFRQREDGEKVCQAFVTGSDEPVAVQMNFPKESPRTFASPPLPRLRPWPRVAGVGGNVSCVPGGPSPSGKPA